MMFCQNILNTKTFVNMSLFILFFIFFIYLFEHICEYVLVRLIFYFIYLLFEHIYTGYKTQLS